MIKINGRPIRRNKNGMQNLFDLRRAVDDHSTLSVERSGGSWEVKTLIDNTWHVNTCPYHYDERQALQSALFGEVESVDEAKYNATK